jgi:site-specific DNA recombinase
MAEAMDAAATVNTDTRKKLAAELKQLGAPEDRFLDLIGDDGWPQEKIVARLRAIRDKRARRVLNQAFFRRLYLDADDDGPYVASDDLTDTVAPLVDVGPGVRARTPRTTTTAPPRRVTP